MILLRLYRQHSRACVRSGRREVCVPGGPNVDRLAVPGLVQHLGCNVTKAARKRVQLLGCVVKVLCAAVFGSF